MQIALYLIGTTVCLVIALFLVRVVFKKWLYIAISIISGLMWLLLVFVCVDSWIYPTTDANIGIGLVFFAVWFFIAFLFLLVVMKWGISLLLKK